MFDKSRIEMERSLEGNYIKVECMEKEKTDYTALKVIQNDPPEFLLKLKQRNVNNRQEFIYKMENMTSIKYMDFNMTKNEFVKLWLNILTPFMEGADWFLDYRYICVAPEFVFADRSTGKVSYIYIPSESFRNTDDDITAFLKELVYSVQVKDGSDFLVKLYQAFGRGNPAIGELYEMVIEEMKQSGTGNKNLQVRQEIPKSVNKPIEIKPEKAAYQLRNEISEKAHPQNTLSMLQGNKNEKIVKKEKEPSEQRGVLGIFGKKKEKAPVMKEEYLRTDGKEEGYEDAISALFDNSDKKKAKKEKKGGLFTFGGKKEKIDKTRENANVLKSNPINISTHATEANSSNELRQAASEQILTSTYSYKEMTPGSDVTEIEEFEEARETKCLILEDRRQRGVPERIELSFSKEQIFIGRRSNDSSQPDVVFGAEHKRMGRRHACLSREKDGYYIVDLGSANSTILNGERLIPNKAYRLNNNDIVGFIASDPIKYRVVL